MKKGNKYLKQLKKEFEKKYLISYDKIPKMLIDKNKIKDNYYEVLCTFLNIMNWQEYLIEYNKDNYDFKYIVDIKIRGVKNDNN